MPMYAYQCTNEECKHTEEYLRKFSENVEFEMCPKCKNVMNKMISKPLWFLGDGYWSRNNYDNRSKHDLEDALKENDVHQRNKDKLQNAERKSGLSTD